MTDKLNDHQAADLMNAFFQHGRWFDRDFDVVVEDIQLIFYRTGYSMAEDTFTALCSKFWDAHEDQTAKRKQMLRDLEKKQKGVTN